MYPILLNASQFQLKPGVPDKILWKQEDDNLVPFSTSVVWNTIRPRREEVGWASSVWHDHAIPRHAFNMWLVTKERLITQDKIQQWNHAKGNCNLLVCALCYQELDSHKHLFFECNFASKVWDLIKVHAGMGLIEPKWDAIMEWLIDRGKRKSIMMIVARLLVATSTYFIWQERNARLFTSDRRTPDQLYRVIMETSRLKLQSIMFKKTTVEEESMHVAWKVKIVQNAT